MYSESLSFSCLNKFNVHHEKTFVFETRMKHFVVNIKILMRKKCTPKGFWDHSACHGILEIWGTNILTEDNFNL